MDALVGITTLAWLVLVPVLTYRTWQNDWLLPRDGLWYVFAIALLFAPGDAYHGRMLFVFVDGFIAGAVLTGIYYRRRLDHAAHVIRGLIVDEHRNPL